VIGRVARKEGFVQKEEVARSLLSKKGGSLTDGHDVSELGFVALTVP